MTQRFEKGRGSGPYRARLRGLSPSERTKIMECHIADWGWRRALSRSAAWPPLMLNKLIPRCRQSALDYNKVYSGQVAIPIQRLIAQAIEPVGQPILLKPAWRNTCGCSTTSVLLLNCRHFSG